MATYLGGVQLVDEGTVALSGGAATEIVEG
jgi:hypothetical protein